MKRKVFPSQARCCTTSDANCHKSPASSPPLTLISQLQSPTSFHLPPPASPSASSSLQVTPCNILSYQWSLSAPHWVFSAWFPMLALMRSVCVLVSITPPPHTPHPPVTDEAITAACEPIRHLNQLSQGLSGWRVMQIGMICLLFFPQRTEKRWDCHLMRWWSDFREREPDSSCILCVQITRTSLKSSIKCLLKTADFALSPDFLQILIRNCQRSLNRAF